MSKIFYDHLVVLEDVDSVIKEISETSDEKEELWKLVDDIVHHRVMIAILDRLPLEYHEEFLTKFREAPHHETHIHFLNEYIDFREEEENIENMIRKEIKSLEKELLEEIRALKGK